MSSNSTQVAYSIHTDRCLMRCWSPADAPLVRSSIDRSSEHLRPWIPFMANEPRTLAETARWLVGRRSWFDNGAHYCYGIFSLDGSELIGEMTLMRRPFPNEFGIGYWVDVEQTGRGYGTECSAAITRLAFEHMAAELIQAELATENDASRAIPKRLGYTHECTRARRYVDCNKERHDLEVFTLFAKDYEGSPSKAFAYEPHDAVGRAF